MTESTYRIQGATGEWEVVIGLEVHAQVTSNAKLFSGAATAFGACLRPRAAPVMTMTLSRMLMALSRQTT